MIGQEGAINLVLARLALQMPSKVAELNARYADNLADLRAPAAYKPSVQTRIEVSQYPMIMIGPRTDRQPYWEDQESGVQAYRVAYAMRIYLIERGNSFSQVEARRQRLTLGIREVLTSAPQLSKVPFVWIDNTSLMTNYFGTGEVADGDSRSIAATSTDLSVMVNEITEPYNPSGQSYVADTIISTVHPSLR